MLRKKPPSIKKTEIEDRISKLERGVWRRRIRKRERKLNAEERKGKNKPRESRKSKNNVR